MHNANKNVGFSLVELVIVIALSGILAISLAKLSSESVYGYIDGKDRIYNSQTAKWLSERLAREVREALPQSVRTNVSGNIHCVEFMDIVNASNYLNLPANGAISNFEAVEFDINYSAGLLVAIMPVDTSSIYNVTGTIASVSSINDLGSRVQINLASPTDFSRRSPQNRFYLLSTPISFCLNDNNGEVTRYDNYAIAATQPTPPSGANSELIAHNISANGTVFNYQPGSLSRASLLQMNFKLQNRNRNLTANQESFEVFHEVHIRNVP
ncbi:prepilin-type N-terminal cleavage/methylation domain-containing protein [Aliikangiella sp. IMCC44653]